MYDLIARKVIEKRLEDDILSINRIEGMGSVNEVFEVVGQEAEYVVRLNNDPMKKLEYQKEEWCLSKANQYGIPSPKVISVGKEEGMFFMILEKIKGLNGNLGTVSEKAEIWKKLGSYAKKFHQIKKIGLKEVEEAEFHANWKVRLKYNLKALNDKDSLLIGKILKSKEHELIKKMLSSLESKELDSGLIHGDLCPRNVLFERDRITLLDWGTAEINVVPHIEIGIIQMSAQASEKELGMFFEGYGISMKKYESIEGEINKLNLLHRLDKYRWAEEYDRENIRDYGEKIISALHRASVS